MELMTGLISFWVGFGVGQLLMFNKNKHLHKQIKILRSLLQKKHKRLPFEAIDGGKNE